MPVPSPCYRRVVVMRVCRIHRRQCSKDEGVYDMLYAAMLTLLPILALCDHVEVIVLSC